MSSAKTQDDVATILKDPDDNRKIDRLVPLLYNELRRLARFAMASENPGHTLNPTALVNETYLRLASSDGVSAKGRTYLMGAAAQAMRRVLVDHARRRQRQKRGGELRRVTLNTYNEPTELAADLIELDDALEKLAAIAPRQAQVVEVRYFGGLTVEEAAALVGVSVRTINNDWTFARTWLNRALNTGLAE